MAIGIPDVSNTAAVMRWSTTAQLVTGIATTAAAIPDTAAKGWASVEESHNKTKVVKSNVEAEAWAGLHNPTMR